MKYILLITLFGSGILYGFFTSDDMTGGVTEKKAAASVYCSPQFDAELSTQDNSPIFTGLGNLHFTISTSSDSAQLFFNQGLKLMYGFNHGEAARSFRTALRHDPNSAMAYWGLAMVIGPNYNVPLNPSNLEDIHHYISQAKVLSANATEREKLLINAIAERFPKQKGEDPAPYYEAYAKLMKLAAEKFPGDVDVATIYADALMNQHPWDLWEKNGQPKPWTPAIIETIESILIRAPSHPGAIHYYIHATEASREAGKASVYADKLAGQMPGAGHIVHMPSHTYIRTGEYHKGVLANELASASDSTYIAQCRAQGFYPMFLYPHNLHFLSACAFLEGNSKKSLDAAWAVARKADKKYLADNITVQHFYSIPYYILIHFGKWKDILTLPEPGSDLKYPSAIWHYARGMAFTNQNNVTAAMQELGKLQTLARDETLKPLMVWDMNSALDLVSIASYSLEAEIAGNNKEYAKAIELLRKAIAIEDLLNYNEPPDWFFSVRLSLGHWLNKAGNFAEAEKVYREDLLNFPENGWALKGLHNSLLGQNQKQEALQVNARFVEAFKYADVTINSSRSFQQQ